MALLTEQEIKLLLAKADRLIKEAQELQTQLRASMAARMRREGVPNRRQRERRRTSQPPTQVAEERRRHERRKT